MQVLKEFWQFLNTDVREIPWGELAEKGIETVIATRDFAADFEEQAPNIKQLQPYFQQVEPFLKTLDDPITQLAISGLPFVSIGIGLLRMYLGRNNIEPTFESSVAIAAQLAYLQSLEVVLSKVNDGAIAAKLNYISLKALVEKQLARLDTVKLSLADAKTTTSRFRESVLAAEFGNALAEQLKQAKLDDADTQRLVEQVAWGAHRYLHQAIAEAGDAVEPLAEVYRIGGQAVQDHYDSIETYLNEIIAPLPEEQVFDERDPQIRHQDIYVPLDVQLLTQAGEEKETSPISSHTWTKKLLEQPDEPRKVMFVEGEAGRGKSVFCRMLADWVRREMKFSYLPILIRLRYIRTLANNLTATLEDCPDLEQVKFVRGNSDWLANRNTRFLIILDGFDELLLEGRATGGLTDFLQQVVDFQTRSHHQFLVTGRPLALQGADRLITQTKNLERVRIEPMNDRLREQWLVKWQAIFDEAEVTKFRVFIQTCPKEIADNLAREPLLIYLLARLHREGYLSREMFADTTNHPDQGIQAKLRVYRESVNWVLEKQRQDENLRLAGLEDPEDLREVLREAALCVVQSGNETARLTLLKKRFQDTANPVADLLKKSQKATGQSDGKALNNLLTTFYLKPGEGDKDGSVEFAHKSFGEYLFAERLIAAFEAWIELDRRKRPILNDRAVNGQIYDLLGHGGLSVEIVEYLFELLKESDLDRVLLFDRLHGFYRSWCEGDFLNQPPTENLPQKKMLQLPAQKIPIGLKQVDVFTGLNVLIVLFKLHAAAQPDCYPNLPAEAPKPDICFHPCGEPRTETFDDEQLLKIIHYADSLEIGTFTRIVGPHLARANLAYAYLAYANLSCANLARANLARANLASADLARADLARADLVHANLARADLDGADLASADLASANLANADLDSAYLVRANLDSADLSCANLARADLARANLDSANLARADLAHANLDNADLDSANLDSAILLDTGFRGVNQLNSEQLEGNTPPLICNAALPPDLEKYQDRDCMRLPAVLRERYPEAFETLEEAEEFVASHY